MPSRSPALDAANQVALGRQVAPRLRDARDVWVVATSASNGYAAALSGRPYSAWIGTGLEDEWAGRRPGLRASRRLAIRVNAPVLRTARAPGAGRRPARVRDLAVEPRQRRPRRRARRWARSASCRCRSTSSASRRRPTRIGRRRSTSRCSSSSGARTTRGRTSGCCSTRCRCCRACGCSSSARRRPRRCPTASRRPASSRRSLRTCAAGPCSSCPSHQEGFGIVAAEAMAAGLPVVTTPSGGPEALVRDSGGGVVLSGFSAEELADRVRALLADPDRLAEMRRRGASTSPVSTRRRGCGAAGRGACGR